METTKWKYGGKTWRIRPDTMDSYVIKEAKQYARHVKIESEDRWLDGGANIGAFSHTYGEIINFALAVEPEPDNYTLLVKNLYDNDNVAPMAAGLVGDERNEILLFLNQAKNPGAHSEFVQRGRPHIKVPAKNINDLLKSYDINAIKLDVEGAEYGILMGIKPSRLKKINKLVFEFHFSALKDKNRQMYKDVLELLNDYFPHVKAKKPKDVMKHWHTVVSAWR